MEMRALTSEEKTKVDSLFAEYKELAAQVGLLDESGNLCFENNHHEDVINETIRRYGNTDNVRAVVVERHRKEQLIYKEMELIRNKIDKIVKKEA